MRARITPEARDELKAAKRWYDEQRPGLGAEFLGAVRAAVERARAMPLAAPLFHEGDDVRRALVERFPYEVLYLVKSQVLHVLMVVHQRRRPTSTERRARERSRRK